MKAYCVRTSGTFRLNPGSIRNQVALGARLLKLQTGAGDFAPAYCADLDECIRQQALAAFAPRGMDDRYVKETIRVLVVS